MVGWILKKIVGSKNQRELRRLSPVVRRINEFDEKFKALSDEGLRAKTAAWKDELSKISDPEEQSRRLVIETIISGHIREGRIQLLEIREGEPHVLAATAAIQRLSRPESWDPEEGSHLELRPMEPGTRT